MLHCVSLFGQYGGICQFWYNYVQSFAKGLLDVSDNLGRASSIVKDSFSKIDESKDSIGAVPLIKTLLEGVEMTNKQLAEVNIISDSSSYLFFDFICYL